MPVYEIDLDKPAEERWTFLMQDRASKINVTLSWLLGIVGKGKPLHLMAEELRASVIEGQSWDDEFLAEMRGMAKALNITEDVVQLANLFYEFGPLACTGIVAQRANGEVIHARNQDFDIVGLPEITVWVKFLKGGKVVYEGTTFALYAGLPTAMRGYGWSVEANTRFQGWAINIEDSIVAAKAGGLSVGYFVRRAIEKADNYADAIELMKTTPLIAPAYYTMVGTQGWEGAVVTRDRDGPADAASNGQGIWSLNQTADAWFRIETNFDHWEPIQDGRRLAANTHMELIGQAAISEDTLFEVLSTPPVLAKDTVYTAKMKPSVNFYNATLRRLN